MSATPTAAIDYVEMALSSVKLALKSAGDNGTVDFLHFCDMAKDNLENAWNNSRKGDTAKKARLRLKFPFLSEDALDSFIYCYVNYDKIEESILEYYGKNSA